MEVSSSQQMYVFTACVISGIICGVLFDIQRSIRIWSAAGKVRTTVEDGIFAIFCTAVAISVGFFFNNGEIRYYQVMGMLSGALFYGAFLSHVVMKLLKFVWRMFFRIIVKPIIKSVKVICIPFREIYAAAKKKIGRLRTRFRNRIRAIEKGRKHLKKRMKML